MWCENVCMRMYGIIPLRGPCGVSVAHHTRVLQAFCEVYSAKSRFRIHMSKVYRCICLGHCLGSVWNKHVQGRCIGKNYAVGCRSFPHTLCDNVKVCLHYVAYLFDDTVKLCSKLYGYARNTFGLVHVVHKYQPTSVHPRWCGVNPGDL